MKVNEVSDNTIVYTFLFCDFFLGRRAYINEEDAILVKDKIINLCPDIIIVIYETTASDLPRDFEIIKKIERDKSYYEYGAEVSKFLKEYKNDN